MLGTWIVTIDVDGVSEYQAFDEADEQKARMFYTGAKVLAMRIPSDA